MIPNVDEAAVRQMWEWAVAASTPAEREVREKTVRGLLLDGTTAEEHERVSSLIEAAKFPKSAEAVPAEKTAEEDEPVKRKRKKRPLLYSPERRGYMRATNEEGIGEELQKMREEAQGTPFFDSVPPAEVPSRSAREKLLENLRAIADTSKK